MASCCDCTFISISDFYGRTNLTENVSPMNLDISIKETQLMYIKPLLCDGLYNELCEQINNNDLSSINEELMCFIKDIHVRYAFAYFIRIHPLNITKESIVRKVSNESEFVSSEENASLAKLWRDAAENYIILMKQFLKDNVSINPLYEGCNECDKIEVDSDFGVL